MRRRLRRYWLPKRNIILRVSPEASRTEYEHVSLVLTVSPASDWVPWDSGRSCYILGTPRGSGCCRTTARVLETISTERYTEEAQVRGIDEIGGVWKEGSLLSRSSYNTRGICSRSGVYIEYRSVKKKKKEKFVVSENWSVTLSIIINRTCQNTPRGCVYSLRGMGSVFATWAIRRLIRDIYIREGSRRYRTSYRKCFIVAINSPIQRDLTLIQLELWTL